MKKRLTLLTVCLAIPFLFACAEEDVVIPIESISLNKTETTLNIGKSEVLKATAKPLDASQEFVWKSSAKNAVQVIGGKITAYALPEVVYTEEEKAKYYDEDAGKYYVEISASNYTKDKSTLKTATCKVFVTDIPQDENILPESISVSQDRLDFVLDNDPSDDGVELSATVLPFDTTSRGVEWTFVSELADPSESGDVISLTNEVPAEGGVLSSKITVTPKKAGTALITAKSVTPDKDGNYFSTKCAVNITKPAPIAKATGIKFSPKELRIEQGQTLDTSVSVSPINAVNKEVVYESDNAKVSVDQAGRVTAASDCAPGTTATITVRTKTNELVPDVADQLSDTITVKVEQHHVNYLYISRVNEPGWVKEELPDPISNQFVLEDIHLTAGDKFVFCTGEDTWHHFANIEAGEGSAKDDFVADGEDIVAGRSGTYDIYVKVGEEAIESGNTLWITDAHYDPVSVSLTVVRGETKIIDGEAMSLKEGSETEFVVTKELQAGDQVIFDLSGAKIGFDQIKPGITAPVVRGNQTSKHIKVERSLKYQFFVESGVVSNNERIWINANYMQIKLAGSEEWTCQNVELETGKDKLYLISNLELAIGDEFVFNVGNGWYHHSNMKSDCDFSGHFDASSDGNFITTIAGKYDFHIDTTNGPTNNEGQPNGAISVIYYPGITNVKLDIKGGSPIELVAKSDDEYAVYDILIPKDTEFIGYLFGTKYGFESKKTGAASGAFGQGSLEESSGLHYLIAKSNLTVSIYIDQTPDDDGNHIWIDANFMLVKKYVPEDIYTNIGPNPEDSNQYKASDVSLGVGDEVVFYVDGKWYHYSDIETTNPYVYSHFENVTSSGNIKVKIANEYTFFVKPVEGTIWINAPITDVTYTFTPDKSDSSPNKWYLDAGAKFYMWAFEYIGQPEEQCRWLEGVNNGTTLIFTIPSNWRYAQVVRLKGDSVITDLNHWAGVDAATEKWNRTKDGENVWLSGVNSNIDFSLINW